MSLSGCAGPEPWGIVAEIGIGLTGFGFIFTFLGILFFFDKGLLAMGNVRPSPFFPVPQDLIGVLRL
jgi:hypothetical protein